jgi:DNA-binding response OmpR family regulator
MRPTGCDPATPCGRGKEYLVGGLMKVLIVDDELAVRRTVSAVLEDEGYEVLALADGEEALEQALAEEPDFILYDATLPGLDAMAFLDKYLGSGGQSLVIVTVAYGAVERMVALMNKGAYDCLPKPFTGSEVVFTLEKSLVREKLRRGT